MQVRGDSERLFLAKRSAKFFFVQSTQREIFYKYPMQIYIIFITACAVFAVFYLRRDRTKDVGVVGAAAQLAVNSDQILHP